MWKCQQCETLNQGEFCVVCGSRKPEETPQQQQPQQQPDIKEHSNVSAKKNNSSLIPVLVVLAVVIIAMAAVIIALVLKDDGNSEKIVETQAPTAETNVVVQTPQAETVTETPQTPAPTVASQPSVVTGDSDDIKWIQDRYYETQDILNDCEVVDNGAGIKYYYYYGNLVRIDVPAGYGFDYDRNYYFNNGKMYFALVYSGKNDQNRFYFKDGWLIRWKDHSGQIHNNEYSNQQYSDWNSKIQQDVARFETY